MMYYFRDGVLRVIALSSGGAVAYGIFHLIGIGNFWDRLGLALLCGLLATAAFFNFVDGLLDDLARARCEAEREGKYIEYIKMRITFGVFLISLFALALSAYPYIADAR